MGTVLKKRVVNDKQLTFFFVPSNLTEYVIQKFGLTEERAEEESEKIEKKLLRSAGMRARN